jgi:transposase-like protein
MAGSASVEGQGKRLHRPLEELCCVNASCQDAGKRGAGNLVVRKGKGGGRWRVLRCSICRTEFSERKGTPLWGMRMPPEQVESVAAHLKEGCGTRKTARLVHCDKESVTRIARRIGLHASAQHDERVRGLKVDEAQFDEKWAFVGKKQKNCDEGDPGDSSKGDQWDHTALDVDSRLVVSVVVGKRTKQNVARVVADFAGRTGGSPPP